MISSLTVVNMITCNNRVRLVMNLLCNILSFSSIFQLVKLVPILDFWIIKLWHIFLYFFLFLLNLAGLWILKKIENLTSLFTVHKNRVFVPLMRFYICVLCLYICFLYITKPVKNRTYLERRWDLIGWVGRWSPGAVCGQSRMWQPELRQSTVCWPAGKTWRIC